MPNKRAYQYQPCPCAVVNEVYHKFHPKIQTKLNIVLDNFELIAIILSSTLIQCLHKIWIILEKVQFIKNDWICKILVIHSWNKIAIILILIRGMDRAFIFSFFYLIRIIFIKQSWITKDCILLWISLTVLYFTKDILFYFYQQAQCAIKV